MRAQDREPADTSRSRRTSTRPTGPVPSRLDVPLTHQAILSLQRTAGNAAVTGLVEARRHRRSAVPDVLRSPGQPLDDGTRADMEARLGADFSDVRLHTGTTARASAAEVGARAYTSGSHIVLGTGGNDRHTLAHELTHVLQQRQGPVAGTDNGAGLRISDPADRFEREAEVNARRALGGPVPARHDHDPTDDANRSGTPVQRADTGLASQPSDMDLDQPERPGTPGSRSSDMDVDRPEQPASQSSEQSDEQADEQAGGPAEQVDSTHKTEVATALKGLSQGKKWNDLAIVKGQVVGADPSRVSKVWHGIKQSKPVTALKRLGRKNKPKGQAATRTMSRPRRLRQLDTEPVMEMYQARLESSTNMPYLPAPGQASTVWAEVEAIGEYMIHLAEARAAAGGTLFQTGKAADGRAKKQAALLTSTTIAGRRNMDQLSLTIPGKDHIRQVAVSGPTTPDQVSTPGNTKLDRVGVYTFNNADGSQSRMNFYAADPEARVAVLPEKDQSTLPAQPATLGSGLTRFPQATKVAGPIRLSKALLAKWSGRRTGSQNSAMFGVSAGNAARASGYDEQQSWQWLHLIAYTMGGRNGTEPNEVGNLAAGLDAANGFHLILENLVKKMVYDDTISDVTVTATANMIPNSFHVCKSIAYQLSWRQGGQNITGTFDINTLNPNKMLGSHTEMLCRRYGINY